MNEILSILTAVINSLWQAAVVAAIVWAALRFWPRTNAATRYAIWWATLSVVLILPAAPRWIAAMRRHTPHTTVKTTTTAPPQAAAPVRVERFVIPAAPPRVARWPFAVFGIWAAILLWRLYQIVRSYVYLRGVKRRAAVSAIPLPNIPRRADLLISGDIVSPMAVGFLKPAVVLPESLLQELSDAEREHVLLHEAAHLARQDDWANLASRFLAGALALHPVALWILWRIDREREIACDEWVVSRTGAARPYAKSLARLFDLLHGGGQMLASGIFGSGRASRVGDRIAALLRSGRAFPTRASKTGVTASALMLCGLMFAGSLVPRWIAFAQEESRPSFEVSSVRPGELSPQLVDSASQPGGRYTATNYTLKNLIAEAWDVAGYHITGGPSWLDSNRFTIEARASADEKAPNIKLMLQSLLEDRFALQVHTETRQEGIYELAVAKGGARLKEAADPAKPPRWNGRGPATGTSVSMSFLARVLSFYVQRTVVDRTGLNGRYDLVLNFATGLDETKDLQSQPGPDAPTLFTALQEQLGLRLVSAKGPAEILVVDRAEKPDAN